MGQTAAAPCFDRLAARQFRQRRRLRRKRSDRPIGPATGQDGKVVQRELVSPHSGSPAAGDWRRLLRPSLIQRAAESQCNVGRGAKQCGFRCVLLRGNWLALLSDGAL